MYYILLDFKLRGKMFVESVDPNLKKNIIYFIY